MDRIEGELIAKHLLDHVDDAHGRSPYRGRSEGFRLKITDCNNINNNGEDGAALLKYTK